MSQRLSFGFARVDGTGSREGIMIPVSLLDLSLSDLDCSWLILSCSLRMPGLSKITDDIQNLEIRALSNNSLKAVVVKLTY